MDPSRPLLRAALPSWPRARGHLAAAVALVAITAEAPAAFADGDAPAAATPDAPAPDEEPLDPAAGVARPAAPDTRTGHLYLDPTIDVSVPFGIFSPGTPFIPSAPAAGGRPATSARAAVPGAATSDILGVGLRFGGVLGYGVSRYAVLEARGAYSRYGDGFGCSQCAATSFDLGIGVSYHLAQGVAIDPWGSFGVGFRQTSFTSAVTGASGTSAPLAYAYRGLDFARVALGADFYPAPAFGLGLYLEAAVGTNVSQDAPILARYSLDTPTDPGGRGFYGFFNVGLRLAFDPLRSGSPRARAVTASRASAPGAARADARGN